MDSGIRDHSLCECRWQGTMQDALFARMKWNIITEHNIFQPGDDVSQKHMENTSPLGTLESKRGLQEVI